MSYAIGIDIGGTNFRIAHVSPELEIFSLEKISSDILKNCGTDSTTALINAIADYIDRHDLKGSVDCISITFPSPVSPDKRIVYACPNIQNPNGNFDGVDVVARLEEALNIRVMIHNDADALLLYELNAHNLKGKYVIGMFFGTGLGNAVYLKDRFLSGSHGMATELSHMPFYKSSTPCTCGNIGCAESHCGGRALKVIADEVLNCHISEVFEKHGDHPVIHDFVEAMAIPVATELNIFDPDAVVIGGGLPSMKGFPYDELIERILAHTRKPYPYESIEFMRSDNSETAGVIGAAIAAFGIA